MQPMGKLVGEARIVALGEATHGTHEFFETKRQLVQFLVETMGFNTVAMEVSGPKADRINEYVQTGRGDPAQLLTALQVWPWDTKEVLDMIEWMRGYNDKQGNRARVSFRGFDMQLPRSAIDAVANYTDRVDPTDRAIEAGLECFRRYQDVTFGYSTADGDVQKRCREGLQHVWDTLTQRRERYEQASSISEYASVLHNARLVLEAEERYRTMGNRDLRDAFMAENVEWILDNAGPDAKVILWAHNTHVDAALPMTRSMGSYLRERFGDKLVSIGFDFYGGSFNATALDTAKSRYGQIGVHDSRTPPSDSYESYLHAAGLDHFVLSLRDLEQEETTAETEWLSGPHPFRSIGTAYDPSRPLDYCYNARLPDEFDLILYIDDTTPSKLLGH